MSTPPRPLLRTALVLAALALPTAAFTLPAVADDAAPLQLGREHLGMTSEDLTHAQEKAAPTIEQKVEPTVEQPVDVQAETRAAVEEAVDDAIEKSEWTDRDLGDDFACACPVCETAAAGVATHADGVDDYASCVEVAIRAGNGFKAASGVCQALFPDPADVAAGGPDAPPATTSY